MIVEPVTKVTDELVAAFERLIPQLGATSGPAREELAQIVGSPGTVLLIARAPERQGEIVGTLTLVLYRIPTGLRAWIEDVVVDAAARQQGVGTALCRAALQRARAAGATIVDLTARPSREEANRLYQHLGFARRQTNVYRYTFTDGE